jgi:hypothetical protein
VFSNIIRLGSIEMPPKRAGETPKDTTECILRIGKCNNVVQWRERMQTEITALYGLTGIFFSTNQRYTPPIPTEADYIPVFPEPAKGEAAHSALPAALITKLREGAFEGRLKEVQQQKADERTVWPMMWCKMSSASQSKVKEEEDFEAACLDLDCVRLWGFIRRTHRTHIYGDGDPMTEVNVQEQETRYAALRQEDKEFISTFKQRFDDQIKANEGAGVPAVTDSKRALEFISKLDTRRKCWLK